MPACCDPKELSKRDKVLDKRNDIASQHPIKNTCFDRQKRLKSLTSLRNDGASMQRSGSIVRRQKLSEDGMSVEQSQYLMQNSSRNINAVSAMNVTAQIPKTTRNKETMGMGLTQPVFPKVVDKLNRTIDR